MPVCSVCKQERECRIRTDGGAYGSVDTQTCKECHEKEMESVRAESRRTGFRLRTVRWDKLTTKGAYSDVR